MKGVWAVSNDDTAHNLQKTIRPKFPLFYVLGFCQMSGTTEVKSLLIVHKVGMSLGHIPR